MQYDRRVVDKEKGIIQITTSDERWYSKEINGNLVYLPSTTWVTGYYPKGIGYMKWLAAHGWDESQALMEAAGEKGSFTHKAVELLLEGKTIRVDLAIECNGQIRELTPDEYLNVMSFVDWHKEFKPKVIKTEHTVFSPHNTHAGTIDFICEIGKELYILDFKTSADIWPSHEIQLTAYRIALEMDAKLAILQLGYKRNKKKWKFTEVEFQPDLWEATYKIWQKECAGIQPLQREYPLELSLKEDNDVKTAKRR